MDKFNLKEYISNNPLLKEDITESDILATIDELNQFLNGNVTKDSLIETLIELVGLLKR